MFLQKKENGVTITKLGKKRKQEKNVWRMAIIFFKRISRTYSLHENKYSFGLFSSSFYLTDRVTSVYLSRTTPAG